MSEDTQQETSATPDEVRAEATESISKKMTFGKHMQVIGRVIQDSVGKWHEARAVENKSSDEINQKLTRKNFTLTEAEAFIVTGALAIYGVLAAHNGEGEGNEDWSVTPDVANLLARLYEEQESISGSLTEEDTKALGEALDSLYDEEEKAFMTSLQDGLREAGLDAEIVNLGEEVEEPEALETPEPDQSISN